VVQIKRLVADRRWLSDCDAMARMRKYRSLADRVANGRDRP
jgi:hypothetical protein